MDLVIDILYALKRDGELEILNFDANRCMDVDVHNHWHIINPLLGWERQGQGQVHDHWT